MNNPVVSKEIIHAVVEAYTGQEGSEDPSRLPQEDVCGNCWSESAHLAET